MINLCREAEVLRQREQKPKQQSMKAKLLCVKQFTRPLTTHPNDKMKKTIPSVSEDTKQPKFSHMASGV